MQPRQVVLGFWAAMQSNDFAAASLWLTADFEGYWPQSGEVIKGRANFAAVNTAYPAAGPWTFEIQSLVVDGVHVVSDVVISDGVIQARAVTFSLVKGDLIQQQREYWPDPFEAPSWRAQWVHMVREEGDGEGGGVAGYESSGI